MTSVKKEKIKSIQRRGKVNVAGMKPKKTTGIKKKQKTAKNIPFIVPDTPRSDLSSNEDYEITEGDDIMVWQDQEEEKEMYDRLQVCVFTTCGTRECGLVLRVCFCPE